MLIIYNPTAGRRRVQRLWQVLDVLAGNGVRFEVTRTRRAGHAAEIARDAVAGGMETIVAAGGDGTIADVASGMMPGQSKLGIIPLGTANVLAHELGLAFTPKAIAACLAFGRSRTLWPGLAEGPHGSRLFVQMLGAGFDAQVVHRINGGWKRALGKGAYVAQSLWELAGYRFPPLDLVVDGEQMRAASAIISKGRLYGGNFVLAPRASPFAPGFSLAVFRHAGPLPTMLYGAALPFDLLAKAPGVELRQASRIELSSRQPVPVQADGDQAGFLPLTVRDAPGPIAVLMG